MSESENSCTFFVDFGGDTQEVSLQKGFKKYLRKKKKILKEERDMKKKKRRKRKSKVAVNARRISELRTMFLQQAMKYFGVPYKRKYWSEEDPEYHEPLFLDCCGLVRRVCQDLREELGFRIGPWNQAYMLDTLPEVLTEEQMQPGDLVFITATYVNPSARAQKHGCVHVEIWLGDGPKTIGARWQKGKVQIFDNYQFQAKSYHSPTYHFRSINTWLKGECKSHCPEHRWEKRHFKPRSKYSIFMQSGELTVDDKQPVVDAEDRLVEQALEDLDAGDTDDELVESKEDELEKENRLLNEAMLLKDEDDDEEEDDEDEDDEQEEQDDEQGAVQAVR